MKPLTRMDKNIANKYSDIHKTYDDDHVLVKNVIAFLAYDYNNNLNNVNLFGKKILDPRQFAKIMGYKNHQTLSKKLHPNPSQFKGKKPEEIKKRKEEARKNNEPLFVTYLDNALYRLLNEPVLFSKSGSTPDGYHYSNLNRMSFLKECTKFYHPDSKRVYYEYELDDTFINNLARFFFNLDINVFSQLSYSAQNFYLYLCNIRNTYFVELRKKFKEKEIKEKGIGVHNHTVSFNFLKDLFMLNCKTEANNKYQITQNINKINELHGENICQIRWQKKGRYNYQPVIDLYPSSEEINQWPIESFERFAIHFFYQSRALFSDLNPNITSNRYFKQKHIEWLKNYIDLDAKEELYNKVFIKVFGKDCHHSRQERDYKLMKQIPEYMEANFETAEAT